MAGGLTRRDRMRDWARSVRDGYTEADGESSGESAARGLPVSPVGGREPWGPGRLTLVVGLPVFAGLASASVWWTVDRVETRLVSEVQADLANAGIDPGQIEVAFSYRDGSVVGTLPSGVELAVAEAAVDHDLLRQLDLSSLSEPIDPAGPIAEAPEPQLATGPVVVVASYDGIRLTVAGTVLNEGQYTAILETLDFFTGRAEIDEQLQISRLAPEVDGVDERIADLIAAIRVVDPAERWTLRLTDHSLTVEVVVADAETAAAVGAIDRQLTAAPTTVRITTETVPEWEA